MESISKPVPSVCNQTHLERTPHRLITRPRAATSKARPLKPRPPKKKRSSDLDARCCCRLRSLCRKPAAELAGKIRPRDLFCLFWLRRLCRTQLESLVRTSRATALQDLRANHAKHVANNKRQGTFGLSPKETHGADRTLAQARTLVHHSTGSAQATEGKMPHCSQLLEPQ